MVEFIGMLKVKVIKGTNLAIRDIKSSDPYVVLSLGQQVGITKWSWETVALYLLFIVVKSETVIIFFLKLIWCYCLMPADCPDNYNKEQLESSLEWGIHAVCSRALWTDEIGMIKFCCEKQTLSSVILLYRGTSLKEIERVPPSSFLSIQYLLPCKTSSLYCKQSHLLLHPFSLLEIKHFYSTNSL